MRISTPLISSLLALATSAVARGHYDSKLVKALGTKDFKKTVQSSEVRPVCLCLQLHTDPVHPDLRRSSRSLPSTRRGALAVPPPHLKLVTDPLETGAVIASSSRQTTRRVRSRHAIPPFHRLTRPPHSRW
mgnify:FL=1